MLYLDAQKPPDLIQAIDFLLGSDSFVLEPETVCFFHRYSFRELGTLMLFIWLRLYTMIYHLLFVYFRRLWLFLNDASSSIPYLLVIRKSLGTLLCKSKRGRNVSCNIYVCISYRNAFFFSSYSFTSSHFFENYADRVWFWIERALVRLFSRRIFVFFGFVHCQARFMHRLGQLTCLILKVLSRNHGLHLFELFFLIFNNIGVFWQSNRLLELCDLPITIHVLNVRCFRLQGWRNFVVLRGGNCTFHTFVTALPGVFQSKVIVESIGLCFKRDFYTTIVLRRTLYIICFCLLFLLQEIALNTCSDSMDRVRPLFVFNFIQEFETRLAVYRHQFIEDFTISGVR